ncbi:MAG: heparinase II/III family protein [Candidatus Kapabacteria bacterium]|nr:heparinase II/III family protein [Candidatus Kapabacteria bacterium]
MRPFLVSKVRDAVRERLLVRQLPSQLPTRVHEDRHLRSSLIALPSASWMAENGAETILFARRMWSGDVDSYGIGSWSVGLPDPSDVDVRSVHELSRMHHWCAYALAAHIEPHNRNDWCERLFNEIVAFMSAYPAEQGTHWLFPMGTGIRLHSMLAAWDWAKQSGWQQAGADSIVVAAAVDHARSTFARRESKGGLSSSHYLANLLGLLAAGCYVEGEKDAQTWGQLATRELKRELARQILDDGMVNEASTGYHRQVTDLFVQGSALMTFDALELRRIALAVERCRGLESIGMPLIGDNDDGLSMKLTGFAPNLSYMYDVAARTTMGTPQMDVGTVMSDFGLTIRRHLGMAITLRNGPVGQFGKGGHAHNDQNSVTLSVGGEAFVVDPGSSCYTSDPATRNRERSVHHHATMWPADIEQFFSPPGEEGLFWLLEDDVHHVVSENTPRDWIGKFSSKNGRCHRRHVTFNDGGITVQDTYTPAKGVRETAEWVLPLGLGIDVEMKNGHTILRGTQSAVLLTWDNGKVDVARVSIAPSFGVSRPTTCLSMHTNTVKWTLSRYPA